MASMDPELGLQPDANQDRCGSTLTGDSGECDESNERTPFSDREKMRLIEPMMTPSIVRTEHSIAALFLGVRSDAEAWFFSIGAKRGCGKYVLWALWFIGIAIGLLVLQEAVPKYCVIGCTLSLPLPFMTFLLLSQDLIAHILYEVEFYIVQLLHTVLAAHALLSLTHVTEGKWDSRCLAIVCYIPSMIVISLLDAYPVKYRALFEILFSSGAILVLFMWNLLICVNHQHGHWDPLTGQIGDNLTLLFFYIRHILTAVKTPNAFVVISSYVHTKHEHLKRTEETSAMGETKVKYHRAHSQIDISVEAPHTRKSTLFTQATTLQVPDAGLKASPASAKF